MNSSTSQRVLVLTPGFGGADGISAVSRSALTALAEWPGARLEVASLADRTRWAGAPAARQRLAAGSKARLMAAMAGAGVRMPSPELVLTLHLHLAPLVVPLLWRGARSSVFLHGIEAWQPLRERETWVLRRSQLIANSNATVSRFREANPGFREHPVAIAHLGIPQQGAEARKGVSTPGRFALMVGRMAAGERYKGHDLLLDLWGELRRRVPDAHLVIAGDGDDRPRLQQRARELELTTCVHFTGRISDEELAALYRDCRFFAMPSAGEGFGLVFLEAMRAGRACLAGTGAAEEIVVAGETGWIADPAQPEVLLMLLERMFREEAATEAMGYAGRQRFLSEFTDEQFAARLVRALGLGAVERE